MKILYAVWFASISQSFGVVVGEDHITKKLKAYIGPCQPGGSEESDAKYIAEQGAKFLPEHAATLNNYLNPEKKDD